MAVVVPHDMRWQPAFAAEAEAIRLAVGPALSGVEHIGSTAVPGILAKPIIDMLGVATSLAAIDAAGKLLPDYEALGEYGIQGRRYFRKDDARGTRTHHLHIFEAGHPAIERHLAFRDYLRAHPHVAADYSALKAVIAERPDYQEAKSAFVATTVDAAVDWRRRIQAG